MIPLYEDGQRGRKTKRRLLTWGSPTPLLLNDPDDDPKDTYEVNAAAIIGRYSTTTEQHPQDDGSEANNIYKDMYVIRLDVTVRSLTYARLYDKLHALAVAFDPALASLVDPPNGIRILDFNVPTEDTTNYTGGLVPSRYYLRARAVPIPPDSVFTGLSAQVSIDFECYDPRRYLQSLTSSATWSTAAIALDNTLASYQSWPTLIIVSTGAGNAAYTLTRAAVGNYAAPAPFVLNLTTALTGDLYTVDMAAHTITRLRAGVTTDAIGLKVSGDWFPIVPGSQTLTPSNAANHTGHLLWRRAFVA